MSDSISNVLFYAEVFNQFKRRIGSGTGQTAEEALAAASRDADKELKRANPNWKWRKARSKVQTNPFRQ